MNLLNIDSLPLDLKNLVTVRRLVREQKLFWQGHTASSFCVVQSGRLKVVRFTHPNQTVLLNLARPGDCLGEAALFSEVYSCTAISETTSEVIIYPKQFLLSSLGNYPALTQNLMEMLVRNNHYLKFRLELQDIRSAPQRLLKYLQEQAQSENCKAIRFDRPLKEVAAELGFTPETLSRALSRLETEGVIARSKNVISLQS